MSNDERFHDLAAIYQAITFEPESRYGKLHITDELLLSQLQTLLDDRREYGLTLCSDDAVTVGNTVSIHIDDPRTGLGLLADTFADVLKFRQGCIREPRFYLINDKWCSLDALDEPEIVRKYRLILKLINLLSECAAYLDTNKQELIFIHDGKFVMPVKYLANHVESLDSSLVLSLLARFSQDTHREQKLSILSKSLQEMTETIDIDARFGHLLSNLHELQKRLDDGYKLFVADFSYSKIVDQLESAKIEELGKIHKVLTDIQNQLLGIPVATIIVVTQLKQADQSGSFVLINSAILFGVWVFSVLCFFLIRNQQQTLKTIRAEITRKKSLIEKEYASVSDIVSVTFTELDRKAKKQNIILYCVIAIILIGLMFSNIAYLILTTPAADWVVHAISDLCSALTQLKNNNS